MATRGWNGILTILLIGLIQVTTGQIEPSSRSYTQNNSKLLVNLRTGYSPDVAPIENGQPVSVSMGMSLISFHFIDEGIGLMSVHAWLKMGWSDSRLNWDPTAFGNISLLRVDPSVFWQPDIELYNGYKVTKLMDHKALLYNTGYIYNLPSYRIQAKCVMNLRYFPYDEQRCVLKYGSWAHDGSMITLLAMNSDIDTEDMHPAEDFVLLDTSLVKHTVKYPCCDEIYEDMTYTLILKRSSGAYSAKLILPSVLSGLMVLATFLLPPASHEKITLCGITFLALLLLLVYLQSIVPASGDTIIGEYLAFALCIDFFATILAVVSYVLHGRGTPSQPMRSEVEFEGDNNDLRIQTAPITKTSWFRYLDLASFVIFSFVFVIGAAIMLGRRG